MCGPDGFVSNKKTTSADQLHFQRVSIRCLGRLSHHCKYLYYMYLGIIIGVLLTLISVGALLDRSSSMRYPAFFDSWKSNSTNLHPTRIAKTHLCIYPIVALVTHDVSHCQGASVLYGSIVRTVIAENLSLKAVCVNFMYIDQNISLIAMYRWEEKINPYVNFAGCRELVNEEMNAIVPVFWYAIAKLVLPPGATPNRAEWFFSVNKVHAWAFDRFERIFILDVDILILRELTKIIDETPLIYDITGGMDGWGGCHDRHKINGGAILIKGSRYLHSAAMQLLGNPNTSCGSRRWELAEQELLNCMCGLQDGHTHRPEFKCHLLSVYNHVTYYSYECPDAGVRLWRLIHFAGASKPWQIRADQTQERQRLFWWCIKEAMSKNIDDLMRCQSFPL